MAMSTLFVTATPIGNLEDITLRAINTLKKVDVIACEDTRHTQIMLNHLEITGKRLIACHAHNEEESAKGIVKLLDSGLDVAYVSDAGTPGISDPGSRLVREVRNSGHNVVPIPGVSASSTLISVAALNGKTFTFEGFLSPKSGRSKNRLTELLNRNEAFIIYESPFRIVKTLTEIGEIDSTRPMVLGREMTKTFEEFITGNAKEIIEKLKVVKGEFALCVLPQGKTNNNNEEED